MKATAIKTKMPIVRVIKTFAENGLTSTKKKSSNNQTEHTVATITGTFGRWVNKESTMMGMFNAQIAVPTGTIVSTTLIATSEKKIVIETLLKWEFCAKSAIDRVRLSDTCVTSLFRNFSSFGRNNAEVFQQTHEWLFSPMS
jgi:hypothetical protein